jgi:hypothetical protein
MRDTMRDKCSLYVDNYLSLKESFKWGYAMNNRLGALLYTMENSPVDVAVIKKCREIIKANTNIFSYFQSSTSFIVATILSLKAEPEIKIREAVSIYESLKREGFHSSPYLVLAAASIVMYTEPENQRKCVTRAKAFFDAMKAEHRFLTTADDYTFAALLALSEKEVNPTIREIESCYYWLKNDFRNSNAVQSLAQVLSFHEETMQVKCKRVVDLYQALKIRGLKFGQYIELPFLGVVAMLPKEVDTIADDIAEVDRYLKDIKGFGSWSIAAKERLMFAAALVCDGFLDDAAKGAFIGTTSNAITSLLLAQQATTITVTSAIAASAAASSAST